MAQDISLYEDIRMMPTAYTQLIYRIMAYCTRIVTYDYPTIALNITKEECKTLYESIEETKNSLENIGTFLAGFLTSMEDDNNGK